MFSGICSIFKRNLLITNIKRSFTGVLDTCYHFHQCGFSGAIFTDQNIHLAFEKVKGYVIQRFCTGINFTDMIRMQKHMLRTFISHV